MQRKGLSMCLTTEVVPTLNELLTPVVALCTIALAVLTIYLGIMQYKTSRDQYRLRLYEKRFAVFKATQCFLRDIQKHQRITDDAAGERFWRAVDDAQFLFKEPVASWMGEAKEKARRWFFLEGRLNGPERLPKGDERNEASQEQGALVAWFLEQNNRLVEIFWRQLRCT